MGRWYYLGPYVWQTDASPKDPSQTASYWRSPDGAIGGIDLRGAGFIGVGFFVFDAPLLDSSYTNVGSDSGVVLSAYEPTAAQRTAWGGLLHLPSVSATGTLLDLLWDVLTVQADPDKTLRCRPIIPSVGTPAQLELHLGGHSLVRRQVLPADVTTLPSWPKIQRVLQSCYRDAKRDSEKGKTQKEQEHHLRWLGWQARKYGLTDDQATGLLIPGDLPKVKPAKPETTITDDFNRADADPPSNAAGGWPWTEVSGTVWRIATNRIQYNAQGGGFHSLRAETDLSGSDHYAQIYKETNVYDDSGHVEGACARYSASAETFYLGAWREYPSGTNAARLYSFAAGTPTQIGSDASITGNDNTTIKVECNGSTIKVFHDGVEKISGTDTAIASGTRTGIAAYYEWNIYMDDFAAADLAAGGAVPHPFPFYYSGGNG